ncbi:MAG: CPBP family intramembrane metalloprotease [Phycisphaerales bacterium]|nr:CPBP family intramembrane metalloprotease [Phycisphaerales bacterium]
MIVLAVVVVPVFFRTGLFRLPRDARLPALPPAAIGGLFAAMLLAGRLGAALVSPWAGLDAEALATDPTGALRATAVLQIGSYGGQSLVVVLLVLLLHRAGWRPWRQVGLFPGIAAGLVVIVVAWPVVVASTEIGAVVQQMLQGEPVEALAHRTLQMLDRGGGAWAVAVTVLAIAAAPPLEEILYRGLAHATLRSIGMGAWPTVIGVSAIFALMHASAAPPAALLGLFVLSLALGWARESSGSLTVPIVAHMAFNAANLALMQVRV